MARPTTIKSWSQLQAGEFGIPEEATHFRWSMSTAQRQKMCDNGRLYALDDVTSRPTNRPNGKVVNVYPVIVTEGEAGKHNVEEIIVKPGINQSENIKYVTLEFAQDVEEESQTQAQTIKSLSDLVTKLGLTLKEPSDILMQIIKEQKQTIKEQAEYISANEGGAFYRFLSQNPELAKEGLSIVVGLGKTAGEFAKLRLTKYLDEQKEFKAYLENQKRMQGEIDVTPKG